MPCGYHISLDDGLITITGSGYIGVVRALELGEALLSDSAFDASLPHLVDLRGLEIRPQVRRKSEAFREFVLRRYQPSVNASVAVVVNDSLDRQSTAALYHLTCSLPRTELFDRYDQALKWLISREFETPAN